jgi:pimeloyl-ACP methyl ester carboxylesterase
MKRLLAIAAILCLAVTGCGVTEPGRFVAFTTPTPSSPVDTIAWRDCESEAQHLIDSPITGFTIECGEVTVPADWATPAGRETMSIALLRVRSVNQKQRIGSLMVNPGGPGGSGRWLAAATTGFLPADVLERFDIVGFDPRGVGDSSPLRCVTDAQKDAMIALAPDPQDDAAFAEAERYASEMVQGCVNAGGERLGLYNTEQTARDMDAIREALHEEKLTYLGYSYGTLLGYVYAGLFGDHVRALVLDGAVDPTQNGVAASEGQAAGFEQAFDHLAADCASRGSACKIGPDARATVNELLTQTATTPVKGEDGRSATSGIVMNAVVGALYSQQGWAQLEQALSALRSGDPSGVFELVDSLSGRNPDGEYDNSMDANTAVNCNDEAAPSSAADVRTLQSEWRAKYPLFGAPLAMTLLACTAWPSGLHDPFPVGEAKGAPPILVIGTTGDPATPYRSTQVLADALGEATVLTWEGEGHTAYPQTRCVRQAVNPYLLEGSLPDAGTVCS